MTVAAHPSHLSCRVAYYQGKIWYVLRHDRAGPDECIASNSDPAHDRRVGANRAPSSEKRFLVQRVPNHLGTWIGNVRQNAGRPQKHVIFNHYTRVHRDVVLDFDIVSNN